MMMQPAHPYTLTIVPSACETESYIWEIRRGSRLVKCAQISRRDRQAVVVEGHDTLSAMIARWRDGKQPRSAKRDKN